MSDEKITTNMRISKLMTRYRDEVNNKLNDFMAPRSERFEVLQNALEMEFKFATWEESLNNH